MTDDAGPRFETDGPVPLPALRRLLDQTTWAAGRSDDGLAAMLAGSLAHVTAMRDGELVGFARAIGDGVYRALVEDVVVDERMRGRGLGAGLMRCLMARLSTVEEVRLVCGEERVRFHARLGFRADGGPHMRRP
jgi:GNAT superfamily N-acetyltransferase